MDPLALVFIPGAIATAAAITVPLASAAFAWRRKLASDRNRHVRCGRCNEPLRILDEHLGETFLIDGIYHCAACAARRRKQYTLTLVAVPIVVVVGALGTATGIILGGAELKWYLGSRLIPILLPSVGLGAMCWWVIRSAKKANRLAAGRESERLESSSREER